ncbi:MAG: ABC transporter permease [Lachnospiraceae bacterium]|nr:ABC transporter permease [Lachnospiraceae bacterium]
MSKYISLTRRNCMVFLRDKTAVFFSLLSMLIVLMLMGVFLGNMNVESITGLLAQYGGERDVALDKENATQLVQYWTLAGLMVVNALTVTLSVIGIMVTDANENKLESFYGAPVHRNIIALSYISAAVIIGMLFCMLTLGIALGYISATGGEMLSAETLAQIFGYTLMNVCIFAIIMYMLALFVKSSSAWGGIATVVGTLVGFVGAIYLPMGSLPTGVAEVLKYIPILHGTSLMRKVCCEEAIQTTFADIPQEVIDGYQEYMGISVIMDGTEVQNVSQILFLCMCGVAAFLVIAILTKRKSISDR